MTSHVEILVASIRHGAAVDQVNNLDVAALYVAGRCDHEHVSAALTENGADINAPCRGKELLFDAAGAYIAPGNSTIEVFMCPR